MSFLCTYTQMRQTRAWKRPGPHKQTGGDSLGGVNDHCFHGDGWDDWMAQIWCKQVAEFVEMESLKTQIAYWKYRQHSHSVHSSQFVPCSIVTWVWWRFFFFLNVQTENWIMGLLNRLILVHYFLFHRHMHTSQQITSKQTEHEHMAASKVILQFMKTSTTWLCSRAVSLIKPDVPLLLGHLMTNKDKLIIQKKTSIYSSSFFALLFYFIFFLVRVKHFLGKTTAMIVWQ